MSFCHEEKNLMDDICKDLVLEVINQMRHYAHSCLAESYALSKEGATLAEFEAFKVKVQTDANTLLAKMDTLQSGRLWD